MRPLEMLDKRRYRSVTDRAQHYCNYSPADIQRENSLSLQHTVVEIEQRRQATTKCQTDVFVYCCLVRDFFI